MSSDSSLPKPPVLYDHLAPNTQVPPPYIPTKTPAQAPRAGSLLAQSQQTPGDSSTSPHRFSTLPITNTDHYHPNKPPGQVTTAFDMYIPTNQSHHITNSHPSKCSCCVHHHKRKDADRVLYRHVRKPSFFERMRDGLYKTFNFLQITYWHFEPWVIRPIIAGLAYNVGIQLARIAIQYFFPSYFPTTVYFPLRANAKFYDLHAKTIQSDQEPLRLSSEATATSSPSV